MAEDPVLEDLIPPDNLAEVKEQDIDPKGELKQSIEELASYLRNLSDEEQDAYFASMGMPPTAPIKRRSIWVPIVCVIILILLFGLAAYGLYRALKKKTKIPREERRKERKQMRKNKKKNK